MKLSVCVKNSFVLVTVFASLLTGCSDATNSNSKYRRVLQQTEVEPAINPYFSQASALYAQKCSSCHSGEVDWSSPETAAASAWVVARDPFASSLYIYLKNSKAPGAVQSMPKNSGLTPDETAVFENWIANIGVNPGDGTEPAPSAPVPEKKPPVAGSTDFERFNYVMVNRCVGCHNINTTDVYPENHPRAGEPIESFQLSENQWSQSEWIDTENPDNSQILRFIRGMGIDEAAETMPPEPLTALLKVELDAITEWVGSVPATGGGGSGGPSAEELLLEVRRILAIDLVNNNNNSSCIDCHNNAGRERLNMTSNQQWIDSGLVAPGNPAGSRLFFKIRGAAAGGNMPTRGRDLTTEEINSIRDWINAL